MGGLSIPQILCAVDSVYRGWIVPATGTDPTTDTRCGFGQSRKPPFTPSRQYGRAAL